MSSYESTQCNLAQYSDATDYQSLISSVLLDSQTDLTMMRWEIMHATGTNSIRIQHTKFQCSGI